MKKIYLRILICAMLVSLLLCGCGNKKSGKKLEEVSAETLINNLKIDSKSFDLSYNIDVDAEVNLGFSDQKMIIVYKENSNRKSDTDCSYARIKAEQTLGMESDSGEVQEYYVLSGDSCMYYYSEDNSTWYGMHSKPPVDVNEFVPSVRADMFKDVKVETGAEEYVVTGKLDIIKAFEAVGDAMPVDKGKIEIFKDVVINVTIKFDGNKNPKYLAISVDESTVPENDYIIVKKCDISLTVNATEGVSVECPQEIIDKAKILD